MEKYLDKNKIVLGISGGVDSTTAALLLKEKGFEVHGMYFDVTGNNKAREEAALKAFKDSGCNGEFFSIDASKEFDEKIIGNFCNEYMCGRTPNPCVICNPLIKFRYLIETADKVGAYYIATGHYADTVYDEKTDTWYIKASESKKDQSYMLYRLSKDVIARLVLPLNNMEDKEAVRKIARESNMSNSELADSQEICFISDDMEHSDFINEWLETGEHNTITVNNEGNFIDKTGKILGKHKGIINYTIGQRKKLGIALGRPVFVTAIDANQNTVTLGDNEELFKIKVAATDCFFTETGGNKLPEHLENARITAKVRYAAKRTEAIIRTLEDGKIEATFEIPQRAPTPGQSIVFYDGEMVIGGGFID